jgi:sugar phosphate permease
MANMSRQIGGAVGLAALVAVSTAGLGTRAATAQVVDGLRTAGWVASAVVLLGAAIALLISKPRPKAAPAPAVETVETVELVADASTDN